MARPQKNNADYFSHDANMRNDLKIRALRRRFGLEGYAVWNFLLEVLTDADHFRIEWDDITVELLAGDFDLAPEKLTEIVNFCTRIDLLQVADGYLESRQHQGRLEGLVERRNTERERKSVKSVIVAENPDEKEFSAQKTQQGDSFPQGKPQNEEVFGAKTPQSKVKYSKVKKSKEKESVCEEAQAHTHAHTQEDFVFLNFEKWAKEYTPSLLEFAEPMTPTQLAELRKTYNDQTIKECAGQMHNKSASKANRSAFLTMRNWLSNMHRPN